MYSSYGIPGTWAPPSPYPRGGVPSSVVAVPPEEKSGSEKKGAEPSGDGGVGESSAAAAPADTPNSAAMPTRAVTVAHNFLMPAPSPGLSAATATNWSCPSG